MSKITEMLTDAANVLFDDTQNDLRALPKTVRLQLLIVLSGVWSTAFSLWIFTNVFFVTGWVITLISHVLVIFAAYYTFKQFHNAKEFRINSQYHTTTRSRQNLWIAGKKIELPKNDPGGEHE